MVRSVWKGLPDDADIAKATASDADAMKYVKGFGVQWNLQPAVATLAKPSRHADRARVWQLQLRHAVLAAESYNPNQPRIAIPTARRVAANPGDSIVSGVNSYNAWNMVLDTIGKSLDGWPQDAAWRGLLEEPLTGLCGDGDASAFEGVLVNPEVCPCRGEQRNVSRPALYDSPACPDS